MAVADLCFLPEVRVGLTVEMYEVESKIFRELPLLPSQFDYGFAMFTAFFAGMILGISLSRSVY